MTSRPHLSIAALAALAGIGARNAQIAAARALKGERWHGAILAVRAVHGRGGSAGIQYEVAVDSLPAKFRAKHYADKAEARRSGAQALQDAPTDAEASGDWVERDNSNGQATFQRRVVDAVWGKVLDEGMSKREAIEWASSHFVYEYGDRKRGKPVSCGAIRKWTRRLDANGNAGLMRARRRDHGESRVIVSRDWDALAAKHRISLATQRAIAERLVARIKGEFHDGAPSAPEVALNVRKDLMDWTLDAVPGIPTETLYEACLVPENTIRGFQHHKSVYIQERDKGLYAAKFEPRIRRIRSHLPPMRWIAGDVHHLNIYIRCEDGRSRTPKAIAWEDLATNRLHMTLVLLEPGEDGKRQGIKRRHVAEAFAALCSDPDFGTPGRIYLDRGSEYGWMDEFTEDLTKLQRRITVRDQSELKRRGVTRARAYTPQAKVIESPFAGFNRALVAQHPNYIGDDRLKKKTESQGKPPVPYRGTFDDLKKELATYLAAYHFKAQKGSTLLDGKSPFERFAEFVEHGWRSVTLETGELAVAFYDEIDRVVRPGGVVKLNNQFYHNAKVLTPLAGETVFVRTPLVGDGRGVLVYSGDGRYLCAATPDEAFLFDDTAGAKEQRRRSAAAKRGLAAMKGEGEHRDRREVLERRVAAAGPPPHAESAGVISISHEHAQAAHDYAALPPPQRRLAREETDEEIEATYEAFKVFREMRRAS